MDSDIKWGLFWIWTVLVFFFAITIGNDVSSAQTYTGTEISISGLQTIVIDAETATVQAGSPDFFVLRQANELIAGMPSQPPLGSELDTYFTFGPQQVSGGKWVFESGSAALNISSSEPISVTQLPLDGIWTGVFVIALLVWVCVSLIGSMVFD